MEIVVHDTISLLRPYFTIRTRPKELFAQVQATLLSEGGALDLSDARLVAAHLYGDELLAAQGHPTVGLPPFAGFEVGYQLVQAYLGHTGESLPEVIGKPTGEILGRSGYNG